MAGNTPKLIFSKLLQVGEFLQTGMPLLRFLLQDTSMTHKVVELGVDTHGMVNLVTNLPFNANLVPYLKLCAIMLRDEPPDSAPMLDFVPWALTVLQQASKDCEAGPVCLEHLAASREPATVLAIAEIAVAAIMNVCSKPENCKAIRLLAQRKWIQAIVHGLHIQTCKPLLTTLVIIATLLSEDSGARSEMLDEDIILKLLPLLRQPRAWLLKEVLLGLEECGTSI
jgi:hypothetical protein